MVSGLCLDSIAGEEVSWLFQSAMVTGSSLDFAMSEEVGDKDFNRSTKNILLLFFLNRKKIKTYLELLILN